MSDSVQLSAPFLPPPPPKEAAHDFDPFSLRDAFDDGGVVVAGEGA